jgi:hypothetical protein
MARGLIYDDVTDSDGNALIGISVEIFTNDGLYTTQATLWDAASGGSPVSNPLITAARGIYTAFAEAGEYAVRVTTSAGVFDRPSLAVFDADDLAAIDASVIAAAASESAASGFSVSASESADDAAASAAEAAESVVDALQTVATLAELQTFTATAGQAVFVVNYYSNGSLKSGKEFIYDAAGLKSTHNGGTVISPTVPWDGVIGATHTAFLAAAGETDPAGAGVFEMIKPNWDFEEFGALATSTPNTNPPSDASIQKCIYARKRGDVHANPVTIDGVTFYGAEGRIIVPEGIKVRTKAGRGAVRIITLAGYIGGNRFVQLGEDSDTVIQGTSWHGIDILGVGFPSMTAAYSNSINENSGFFDCQITCDNYALRIAEQNLGGGVGSPKNFSLSGLSLRRPGTYSSANGISEIECAAFHSISDITISGSNSGDPYTAPFGMKFSGACAGFAHSFHIEGCDDGLRIGNGVDPQSGLTIISVNGPGGSAGPVVDLVALDAASNPRGLTLIGLYKRNATNVLNDTVNGAIYTQDTLANYQVGDGTGDFRSLAISAAAGVSRTNQFVQLRGRQFKGRSSAASITAAFNDGLIYFTGGVSTLTLPDVTTLADSDLVELVVIHTGSSGSLTFSVSGGNLLYGSAGTSIAPFSATRNTLYTLIGVNSGVGKWYLK